MLKEEGKDILCFVHNVSPVKQSQKTTCFTAQLQTSNDVVRAVSFSPKRRSELCKYEDAKSPVKVSKFKMSAILVMKLSTITDHSHQRLVSQSWADPVLGKLGACLRYKISDILELLMRCSITVKL